MMLGTVEKFEKVVYAVLMAMLVLVLGFAIIELGWTLFTSLTNEPMFLLENRELVNVLGVFLLVLIGVELLDTMKAYLRENVIHVEVVVVLAIIAIARKVILLDPALATEFEMIGIGVMVIGLAGTYFLIKKAGITIPIPAPQTSPEEKESR